MKNNSFAAVLSISSFRDLWLSQLLSQVFMNLLFFSLMLRVYELTRTNSAVSLMVLVITLPNILLGALAGVLIDRGERKFAMFLSHFLRVFAVLAFLLSAETLGWLFFLTFLIGVISQFFFPAESATIHELVTDKKLLLTANSIFTVTFFVSVIIGNVLAGPFLHLFGSRGTFLIVAFAFLCASGFTARLPGKEIRVRVLEAGRWIFSGNFRLTVPHLKVSDIFSDFLIGLNHIYRNPRVQKAILVMGVAQITVGVLGAVAPGFADKVLHVPVTDVSVLVMAPAAFGMVLGAFVLGQFFSHVNRDRLIRIGFFAISAGLIVFSLVDFVVMVLPLPLMLVSMISLVSLGVANSFLDVPVNTLIQENTPEEVRSRVYGVVSTVIGIASIIPVVLAGAFGDIFGVRFVVLGSGLILAVLAMKRYTER